MPQVVQFLGNPDRVFLQTLFPRLDFPRTTNYLQAYEKSLVSPLTLFLDGKELLGAALIEEHEAILKVNERRFILILTRP